MSAPPDPRLADNLRRWIASDQPRRWVESKCGGWGSADWLVLLANLRFSEFWPLDPGEAKTLLERLHREKQERDNVRRWVASGQARGWIEAHRGRWGPRDWLALLAELRASPFWPVRPEAVRRVLDELRAEWRNLRRWQQSGQPQLWVEACGGRWDERDWLSLLDGLRQSAFWPMQPEAVGRVLETVKAEAVRRPGQVGCGPAAEQAA